MNKIQIAYVHPNMVSHSFHHSMMRITKHECSEYELMPHIIAARGTAMALPEARNEIMRRFLDETDATHLWTIDTDMGFPSNTIAKLLAADHLVIGALCYGQAEVQPDDMGGYLTAPYPVAYDLSKDHEGRLLFTMKEDLDVDSKSPQHVAATGTGCLLIHRNAGELVRQSFGETWFDQVAYENTMPVMRISEDLSFCYRLASVGVPVYVHTGVRTSHLKNAWLQ